MPAQPRPRGALLIGIVVVQVVAAHFAARQNVVLAPVDDVERHAEALHQRGASAAQVMRRPCPSRAGGFAA